MSVLEIVAGVLLIIACIIVTFAVLAQEGKGQGLSSVITGTDGGASEGRGRGRERQLERITRYAGIIFAVLTVLVNIFVIIANKA